MKEETPKTKGLASRRVSAQSALPRAAPSQPARRMQCRRKGNPANQPPNIPDWTRSLGEGVVARALMANHRASRSASSAEMWNGSTASRESSVSFTPLHALDGMITPNGLCFERHHSGIAEVDPADYRLILHGLVDKPLIFTLDDIKRMPRVSRPYFLRMRSQFRHGMARRTAQRLPVHARHGPLRDVHRRAAEDPARRSGRQAEWRNGCCSRAAIQPPMTRSLPMREGAG